jgi:hypothetical protein
MSHSAQLYYTLESLLEHCAGHPEENKNYERSKRRWTRKWNQHKIKHPGQAFIMKCAICSGEEYRQDVKLGKWKESTRAETDFIKKEIEEGKVSD